MPIHPLEEILHPQSIAVVGASNPGGRGAGFVTPLLELGFKGKIYPVNPRYSEVLGLKCYPTVKDIPGPVDYVISAVPAAEVLKLLDDSAQKGVKGIHLYTARFSETGRQDAADLEQKVLKRARQAGIRIIGPNCMGLHYPKLGISWGDDFPRESGPIALVSQSGGVATEVIRLASLKGLGLSKAISYGNALDFNECDYLEYFSQDPETDIIMMYIEGVRDGQRFFRLLRQVTAIKPVIIVKGGRGRSGTRATASHTASLAGTMEIWKSAIAQAGAVSADNLDELLDLTNSFKLLPPIRGVRVGVAGGGGGASVLAADQCEEAGLDVIPLPMEIREEMKNAGIAVWDWLNNPADMSINMRDDFGISDALRLMAKNQNFDLLIVIISDHWGRQPQEVSVERFLKTYKLEEFNQKPLLAVVGDKSLGIEELNNWRWKLMSEVRTKLMESNIAFYPDIRRAASAAKKLADYYRKKASVVSQ